MKLKPWHWVLLGAILIAAALSPFASKFPDGLEHVAGTLGFAARERHTPLIHAPLPDYSLPLVRNPHLATSLAGLAGVLILFGAVYGVGQLLARRSADHDG